jgi:hypothetical protein
MYKGSLALKLEMVIQCMVAPEGVFSGTGGARRCSSNF